MSDEKKNSVVKLEQYSPTVGMPEKSNPSVPDHVWTAFQHMGEMATAHLARLLSDPRFANFEVKEQMRIIETTLTRAYGSPDGSVRRHLHVHANPEDDEGFNALRALSRRANRSLPEFRQAFPSVGEASEDVDRRDKAVLGNTLDADICEDVASDGD